MVGSEDWLHNEEILSWLADALRELVRAEVCIGYVPVGGRIVRIRSPRALHQGDLTQLLRALSSASPESEWNWETVLVNGQEASEYAGDEAPRLRRVLPLPLAVSGRTIGAMAIGTWDELVGPRSLQALKRIATEVGTALQALWKTVAKERDKLEAILENLIDGIVLIDDQERILAANTNAVKLLRLKKARGAWVLTRQDEAAPLADFLRNAREAHQLEFNRIWRSPKPASRILGIKGRRIRDAENRDCGWLVQIRDITQSWHAERFRNDILSVASHEIHTPLTSMNDAVSLLLEGELGPLTDRQRHLAELLKRDIERLSRLVDRLLDVGRYSSPTYSVERRQSLDVVRTLSAAIEQIQYRAARKSLTLLSVIPEELPRVPGDRDQLLQVVQNLLDNAVKFTPVGGVIEVGARMKSGEIEVWVRDTGIGIPEEYHEWIFEKFTRLREDEDEEDEASGHGLGLSVAKAVVESWGGRIWVESKKGQGSVFRFTIPVQQGGPTSGSGALVDAEPERGHVHSGPRDDWPEFQN